MVFGGRPTTGPNQRITNVCATHLFELGRPLQQRRGVHRDLLRIHDVKVQGLVGLSQDGLKGVFGQGRLPLVVVEAHN